jgi:hypothetical protein
MGKLRITNYTNEKEDEGFSSKFKMHPHSGTSSTKFKIKKGKSDYDYAYECEYEGGGLSWEDSAGGSGATWG